MSAVDLCRKHWMSDATFYKWRLKNGGMELSDTRNLRARAAENAKLRRLLAESLMDISTLKEMMGKLLTPGSLRAAVNWAITDKSYSKHRHSGCRLLHTLLRREGIEANYKNIYQLYLEEYQTVRNRGGRKRALSIRAPMTISQGSKQRWSLDFVSGSLVDGRRFRILCVIDDFSRESRAMIVHNWISSVRVNGPNCQHAGLTF
jgi:putative transposase